MKHLPFKLRPSEADAVVYLSTSIEVGDYMPDKQARAYTRLVNKIMRHYHPDWPKVREKKTWR